MSPRGRSPPSLQLQLPMSEALVGRQPIYDRTLDVYGYELLFRKSFQGSAEFDDGDAATSRVILNAFHTIGIQEVVGTRRAFINLTRGFIVGDFELPVPTEGVVLEVLEHVEPDEEVLEGLRSLQAKGFTIALDDFVLDERSAKMLDFASIVKLDIVELGWEAVEAQVAELRTRELVLIAEQVRSLEDFERCRALGFDLYQGYFLSRPSVIRGRKMKQGRQDVVEGLSAWLQESRSPEEALDRIPKLREWCQELLRLGLVDAADGESTPHPSVLRNLVLAFILCGMKDRPRDLSVSALFRARMCELLSARLESGLDSPAFTTGLISTLGSMLECSLPRIVEDLPLLQDVRFALLSQKGAEGELLACVLAFEAADWDQVRVAGVEPFDIQAIYLSALAWAESVEQALLPFLD